uniref:SCAN box domain-containing protein n=1 Tax=Pygocentrus nattereri TaxID=42514 RepID=A0AAR2JZ05_PYGNA
LATTARSAYVSMDVDESSEYALVKEAILKKYSINAETYRQRFRSLEVSAAETPKEVYVKLRDLYQKRVKPTTKPVKQIGEIILEQFLRMLCPELQVWIREHDPPSAEEAARLADVFVALKFILGIPLWKKTVQDKMLQIWP